MPIQEMVDVWHPDADRREGEPSAVIDLLLQRLVMRVREATKGGCDGHSVESRVAEDSIRIACMAMESTLEMQSRDNKRLADEKQRLATEVERLTNRLRLADDQANNKACAAAMWEKLAREAGVKYEVRDVDASTPSDVRGSAPETKERRSA